MIEPVEMADFFISFFAAASVIVFGALYALLFAFSKIKCVPRIMPLAYACYAVLFASVITLARVAHLFSSLFWVVVVVLMLVGYMLAPHAIWHLCVSTHEDAENDTKPAPLNRNHSETFHQSCKEKAS